MSASNIPPEIRRAAANWRTRVDAGLDEKARRELERWRKADSRHGLAFDEVDATWRAVAQLSHQRPSGEPDPDLFAPNEREPVRKPVAVTLRLLAVTGLAAAAVAVIILRIQTRQPAGFSEPPVREMALTDGSRVQLNDGGAVAVHYSDTERRLELVRGEAHFDVVPAARPFVVQLRGVHVRAVGTAFNIRLAAEQAEIVVTEGAVAVEDSTAGKTLLPPLVAAGPPAERRRLVAKQRAVIALDPGGRQMAQVDTLAPGEIERVLAWREPRLEFADVSLTEAVEAFNRYNEHKLVIADSELGAQRFGGTFRRDGYEAFVRLLENDFDVSADRQDGRTILQLRD